MRIALCFSGQIRTLDDNIDSIRKYIIDRLPVKPDIFCYFSSDKASESLRALGEHSEIVYAKDPELDTKDYDRHISDGQWKTYKDKKTAKDGVRSNLLQWYFMKRCNELKSDYEKSQGFRYDWVIWTRPDLLFMAPIEDLSGLDSSRLYIPKHSNYGGLMDRFAFSCSEMMDIRMGIYDWFDHFHNNFDRYVKYLTKKTWSAEAVLYCYIRYKKIRIARTKVITALNRGKGVLLNPAYETRYRDVLTFRQRASEIKRSILDMIYRTSARLKQESGLYSKVIEKIKGH